LASSDPVIYALLCTHNSVPPSEDANVSILTVGAALHDGQPIEIPASAFKPGAVYHFYTAKLVDDCGGRVKFVGQMYKTCPLNF